MRSGFRVQRQVAAGVVGTEAGPTELVVEFADATGRRLRRAIHIQHDATGGPAIDRDAWRRLFAKYRSRTGHEPAVLDVSGLELARAFPDQVIFSPPDHMSPGILPYIDRSVDLVAISPERGEDAVEARRVAIDGLAIFTPPRADGRLNERGQRRHDVAPTIAWTTEQQARHHLPTASIIIPTFNGCAYVDRCLTSLVPTLPDDLQIEIIVVDDGSTDGTMDLLARWAYADRRIRALAMPENQGFIDSCNRGAEAAINEVLIFLNNDTEPQPGWFEPLLRVLRDKADAGAVGGKLLYPNGLLQEAGGIVFADGSAWNFGRYAHAVDSPLFSFLREVDYCSGALLATWRDLFLEDGGFDRRYTPAYYEDTDYCFRVRSKGKKVYYQPESVVVHLDGGTAGTDTAQGVKAYQLANQTKFAEKWQAALSHQPTPPPVVDEAALMRIAFQLEQPSGGDAHGPVTRRHALVCAPLVPEFDREGGSRRILHLIQYLRAEGWAVSFYAQHATPGSERYRRLLRQLGVAVYAGNYSTWAGDEFMPDIKSLISDGQFGLAILVFWQVGELLTPLIRTLSPETRVIVDSIDLHFLRQARHDLRANGAEPARLHGGYGEEIMREINAYASADAVLTVSQDEATLLNTLTGRAHLAQAVPLIDDLRRGATPVADRRGILFVGNFRHGPNTEAVAYLCHEILPLLSPELLAQHPVYIVGTDLNETVRGYADGRPEVRMVGWVPTVEPYLDQVRTTVAPLLHGAGVKVKLVQALMAGTPSVSTSIGVEGLALTDEEQILIADEPAAFARAIERLLTDDALWQRLADQGYAHIVARNNREVGQEALMKVINHTLLAARRLEPDRKARPAIRASVPALPDSSFYSPLKSSSSGSGR
jgi:GT2 family glycosyltransferase/glycosyltransferase involved in cell wall biosynthesis